MIRPRTRCVDVTRLLAPVLCLVCALPALAQDQLCQVHVATQPEGAAVILDGNTRGVTPMTLTAVTPGTHLVAIQKDGYYEERRTLRLDPQQRTAIDLKMEEILGLVLIKAEPEGTTVFVNDAERGQAPLLITDLPMGEYRLRFEAPTYITKEIDLRIPDRTPIKIDTALMPNTATIELSSEPTGARVLLNGLHKGFTPLTLDGIPAGEATLKISTEGYEAYAQTITMEAGQLETLNAVLSPLPATLAVSSIPPGARIYVNDDLRGETPVRIAPLNPGTYELRAELEGYETMERQITVGKAEEAIEEFKLWSNSGLLEVITEPAGVRVFVEGTERGVTATSTGETDRVSSPLTVRLPEGTHTLQLSKQGYYGKSREIRIEIDATATIHETLQRRFIPNYEVVTDEGSVKGFLLDVLPNGDVRLEVRPGIRRTIKKKDILDSGPLRD